MLRYIKLDIIFASELEPHLEFLGSTLRGAFGIALKQVCCFDFNVTCEKCSSQTTCLYYNFFSQSNTIHSYRFSKLLNTNNFNFTLYLFEEACYQLPYVLNALYVMLTQYGLGVKRETFTIQNILCNGIDIYNQKTFDISKVSIQHFEVQNYKQDVRLYFMTPLRMKSANKLLMTKPTLEQILTSIVNRFNELMGLPLVRLSFKPIYREEKSEVTFIDLTRYSNRQQTKMQLGGIIGHIDYVQLDEQSYRLLKLGEILGVGKQTVFGLGEIKVEHF